MEQLFLFAHKRAAKTARTLDPTGSNLFDPASWDRVGSRAIAPDEPQLEELRAGQAVIQLGRLEVAEIENTDPAELRRLGLS
ncbi:hypothetical protein [Aureimonas sp. AU12]|uniref:hypothetical protein n=1 Tax=Aureimonas sp. AU12 TaxID=1638161 RepID=UPI0007805AF9|nr:hypothetical protein [Aureimonas sp. AU12]